MLIYIFLFNIPTNGKLYPYFSLHLLLGIKLSKQVMCLRRVLVTQ